ncbi:MAG: hypothetical protein LBU34_16725 [Planctomycetaceae bacterium]|nr:hypothetical protein [Planctomycetaceae bacterium]
MNRYKLCKHYREEIVTEAQAEKNGWNKSQITSDSEAKMIRLQKELTKKVSHKTLYLTGINSAIYIYSNE